MLGRLNYSLTQLEYVLAVNKFGHFSKAAAACHVSQPTLSMQLQKLENDLGVVIFDRSKKPVLLTDVGHQLIEQIQKILFEARKMNQLIMISQERGLEGQLILGVIPTVAPYLLPRLLPVVEKLYPGLRLKILELQTHQIIEHLNEDELDVGVLAIPVETPGLLEEALYCESFSILCHKGHELSGHKRIKSSMLKAGDLWLLEEGHCLRHQVLDVCALRGNGISKRKFSFESGSLETLKNLIETYGGYTLLPALAGQLIGRNSCLIPFEKPIPAREIGFVFRREHYKAELIKALREAVLSCIPEELRKTRRKDLEVLPI
jgi:LysR family hydrogen peroxide-inducible transcriptional activator